MISFSTASKRYSNRSTSGFTLIELMIVIAVIAIIITLALPTYSDYQVRTKVAEGLSVAAPAKTATASTCQEDRTLTNLDNFKVGVYFDPSTWVSSIQVTGACVAPVISVTTQNTGAGTDPVIILTGNFDVDSGRISWVCSTTGSNAHVPKECRV
jgi:type IV pilus assembly protein PilA